MERHKIVKNIFFHKIISNDLDKLLFEKLNGSLIWKSVVESVNQALYKEIKNGNV
jgi:hypothetical protein